MPDRVRQVCEACFGAHANDCSGFARPVAQQFGVPLNGPANDIVETIRNDSAWTELADGVEAERKAAVGKLVIGGLRGDEQAHPDAHGHIVVVVAGQPLHRRKYPFAYWGRFGGGGKQNETVNWPGAQRIGTKSPMPRMTLRSGV